MSDFIWTDLPNDPAVPLAAGKDEPLNFQALKDVDRIIVDEGLGDEVVAYRSGAFRGRYAALSTMDASRNVALMRAGGWPASPTVLAKVLDRLRQVSVSASYTASLFDWVMVNANSGSPKTITLPAGVDNGDVIAVRRDGTVAVTVAGAMDIGSSLAFTTDPEVWVGAWDKATAKWRTVAHQVVAPPLPTGGQAWGAIYELNFTTLPSQTFGATNGAYLIDGLTWYAKGLLTGYSGGGQITSDLVNGTGLKFTSMNVGSTPYNATNTFAQRHFFLPLANVPGFNPNAPYILRFRSVTLTANNGVGVITGLTSSTNDGASLTSADRKYDNFMYFDNGASGNGPRLMRNNGTPVIPSGWAGNTAGLTEVAIYRLLNGVTVEAIGASNGWTGSFGSIDALQIEQQFAVAFQTPRPNPGVFVSFTQPGSVTGANSALTHMRIDQPRVP
jgi:hypothetical protein